MGNLFDGDDYGNENAQAEEEEEDIDMGNLFGDDDDYWVKNKTKQIYQDNLNNYVIKNKFIHIIK